MIIPNDPKNAQALRDFYTQQRAQLCGLSDALGEPWATHFNRIKGEYDAVLSKLGVSDQVPAALDANYQLQSLYSMLVGANSLTSMLSAQMNSMKTKDAAALCSAVDAAIAERVTNGEIVPAADVDGKIAAAVAADLKAKTDAGELVPKEMHSQLCSAAKEAGVADGKALAVAEQVAAAAQVTLIETRKVALQTAGIPIPAADIEKLLGGTEEEFTAVRGTAEKRVTDLKTRHVFNSKLGHYVWLNEESYKTFDALASEVLTSRGTGEPFAQPGGGVSADSTKFLA